MKQLMKEFLTKAAWVLALPAGVMVLSLAFTFPAFGVGLAVAAVVGGALWWSRRRRA